MTWVGNVEDCRGGFEPHENIQLDEDGGRCSQPLKKFRRMEASKQALWESINCSSRICRLDDHCLLLICYVPKQLRPARSFTIFYAANVADTIYPDLTVSEYKALFPLASFGVRNQSLTEMRQTQNGDVDGRLELLKGLRS